MNIQELYAHPVFKYFEEISKIPRGSGNEKAVSDYLMKFAAKHGLNAIQDKALNVIIKKPGTEGYADSPAVIIQGHMDMVCDKNKSTIHDFKSDPINLRVQEDMLYASGTTLGADDGIAVAYALALLASNDIPHPPLEVVITTEEEVGLKGAEAFDTKPLDGRMLINIDSESEGQVLVSCAGGVRTEIYLSVERVEPPADYIPYRISIRGLKGGHSGEDINKNRGNSNKLMGRILYGLSTEIRYCLKEVNGGQKLNAIPREADALIMISPKDCEKLLFEIEKWDKTLKNEYKVSDPNTSVSVSRSMAADRFVLSKDSMKKAIAALSMIPNGIQTMSASIEGLVESSSNLGVVITYDKEILFESAIRSSVSSLKYNILDQSKLIADVLGAKIISYSDYPEWEYNPDSKLRSLFRDVYRKKFGHEMKEVAIHAGIECGILGEKIPGVDMVSIGPDMFDVHTPDEHLSIPSALRTWELLISVLKEIK